MQNRIIRTLFWFKEEENALQSLNNDFFSHATLFNKLLNETYQGPKMKFVNFYFYSDKVYERFPVLPKGKPYFSHGHLTFYGVLNFKEFFELSEEEKISKIWELAYQYFQESAVFIDNSELAKASKYAYEKAKALRFNTDLEVLKSELTLFGQSVTASIWIITDSEGMKANFVLVKDGRRIFEKIIVSTKKGVEMFFEMFQSIVSVGSIIIINGMKNVEGLPISINIDEDILK